MQKGQVSIDLLFTLVAAILIIISFSALTESVYLTHSKINTKHQLDLESEKLASLITQTQMIDETSFQIETALEKITYLDKNNNQVKEYPLAEIRNSTLVLSVFTGDETIESQRAFAKNQNTTITIGEGETLGRLVISNAQ